ncbi:hypothetical protein GMB86_09700 [Terrilactibacillus sp. BCM23-1]|uniref:Magnesium transporter MgtE intracellular domain-containing protein n=1 Tax=Terrilactibacillus tamarindi TaxID=2599694 RepID=A0A6N8CSV2_9BACI|nr:hypothetical protein [Terrilactibacillus tamarindi]MTT32277.1 hypothetical protein [Terrilactibacillus tamarindi]
MEKTSPALKIIKVLLVIIIPLMFLGILTLLIMNFVGLNPMAEMKSLINGKTEKTNQPAIKDNTVPNDATAMRREIASQSKTINKLRDEITQKSDQIDALNKQIQEASSTKKTNQTDQSQTSPSKADLVNQTYRNMDPEKAAAIFEKMNIDDASAYINMLDNKTKAQILNNMDPAKAADITKLLKPSDQQEGNTGNTTDPSSAGTSSSPSNETP